MTDDADDHPGRHGDDLAADQGRHPRACAPRARRSAWCGCAGSGRSRPRSSWPRSRRRKAIGVIDRDYSFGSPFGSGVVANEIRAALYNADQRPPLLSFICGLGGREVTLEDVYKATDLCYAAAQVRQVRRQDPLARASGNRGDDAWRDDDVQQRDADPGAVPRHQAGHDRGVLHLRVTGPARAASRRWS